MTELLLSKNFMNWPIPDLKNPWTFIVLYAAIIYCISITLENTPISEYFYFYLSTVRLLLALFTLFLFISIIFGDPTVSSHLAFFKLLLTYSIIVIIYWYRNFSLSFEDAKNNFFYFWLPFIGVVLVFLLIFVGIGKLLNVFLSSYNGDSRVILFFKELNNLFNYDKHDDYFYSRNRYSLKAEQKQEKKIIGSLIILIILSFSLLYLPSILSSSSPRLYDIYAIHGSIKAQVDEEYSINKIVYVPVEIGGLDSGLSITLSKFNSGKFEEISSIILYPNQSIIQKNNSLSGRVVNYGSYEICLDPSSDPKSLSEGDYQFKFKNSQNKNISSNKVFSLSSK